MFASNVIRTIRRSRLVAATGGTALVAAVFLGAATLVSAHGGDTSKVHSCVSKIGAIRIVGADTLCDSKETPLDWATQGVPGPPGADGNPRVLDTGDLGPCAVQPTAVQSAGTLCATRTLPPGTWDIAYGAEISTNTLILGGQSVWTCTMLGDGRAVDTFSVNNFGPGVVALRGSLVTPVPVAITVNCGLSTTGTTTRLTLVGQRLMALSVSSAEPWQ